MTVKPTQEQIIDNYLNYYRTKDDKYSWADNEVEILIKSPDSLDFVFHLIQACKNDHEIAYVAAGPLEDLFTKDHSVIKDKLSTLVRQYAIMRKAVQCVYASKGTAERKALDEILEKYGLSYGGI